MTTHNTLITPSTLSNTPTDLDLVRVVSVAASTASSCTEVPAREACKASWVLAGRVPAVLEDPPRTPAGQEVQGRPRPHTNLTVQRMSGESRLDGELASNKDKFRPRLKVKVKEAKGRKAKGFMVVLGSVEGLAALEVLAASANPSRVRTTLKADRKLISTRRAATMVTFTNIAVSSRDTGSRYANMLRMI